MPEVAARSSTGPLSVMKIFRTFPEIRIFAFKMTFQKLQVLVIPVQMHFVVLYRGKLKMIPRIDCGNFVSRIREHLAIHVYGI